MIPITDLWVGLIKAPVFGFIIALAGCFQGMLVEGDAEQVGLRTTAAVVQAIFLVIVLDAVFAVFFSSRRLDMSTSPTLPDSEKPSSASAASRNAFGETSRSSTRISTSTSSAARSSASSAARAPASRC